MDIRAYDPADRDLLIALWREVFPDDGAHNEAGLVLTAKLQVDDDILLAVEDGRVLGAAMTGYDGHRGWLYSVAVHPDARRRGIGAALIDRALDHLRGIGCIKVNLQVRSSNHPVVAFYESLGFTVEDRISMGRLLTASERRADPGAVDRRIAFVGDSYVQGAADEAALGWVGRIVARARHAGHDVTGYNLGVRRDTSQDVAARWEAETQARFAQPGIAPAIVFSFGINDATVEAGTRRVAVDRTLATLGGILDAACRIAPVLFVGPAAVSDPQHNARLAALCPQMAAVADRAGVPYLPLCVDLMHDADWLDEVAASDGAHPGARGYRRIAGRVQRWPAWQSLIDGGAR